MAITNAQQYQQHVNKPANGKRPGYRGDDAARSERAAEKAGYGGTSRADPDTRGSGPSGTDDRGSPRQNYNTAVATGRIDPDKVDPPELNEREQEFQNFLDRRNEVNLFGLSKFLTKPVQKFSNFNASVNRPFFGDVIRAGKIPGLNFDMTEEEYEDAYQNYMSSRLGGEIDAYGNPLNTGNDGGGNDPIIPLMANAPSITDQEPEVEEEEPFKMNLRLLADGGMPMDAPMSGIMNTDVIGGMADGSMDDMGRQMYGLGKLVKKATRAISKVAKSDIGKAALTAAAFYYGGGGKSMFKRDGLSGMFGNFFSKKNPLLFTKDKLSYGKLASLSALTPFLMPGEEDDTELNRGADIDDPNKIIANPYDYANPRIVGTRFAADGGIMRVGYQEGGDAEPVAKKTMPLLDMDGQEMDLREEGGFVPLGRMERADDVPARLSKNEFVFTADAVRNAGEGDIDKGAEVMYNMMKNLESGGEVSEESQGLDGAREMFKTSQRLEEVL